jgi:hypothetical protein
MNARPLIEFSSRPRSGDQLLEKHGKKLKRENVKHVAGDRDTAIMIAITSTTRKVVSP